MVRIIEESARPSGFAATENIFSFYQARTDVYFSSREYQLLAKPPFAHLPTGGGATIAEQVEQSLRFARELHLGQSTVVGAIPFDTNQQPWLRLSNNVTRCTGATKPRGKQPLVAAGEYRLRNVPGRKAYTDAVNRAVSLIGNGALDKVVLSRALDVECGREPDVKALIRNLEAGNPNGYTFSVPLTGYRSTTEGATFIGASPELLVAKQGSRVIAHPLAGSEPRSDDAAIDRRRAGRLMQSAKDRYEHDLVVQAIDKALRPFCRWLHVPKQPSLVSTGTMWHLATRIEGELLDPSVSSVRLALALHPTPAVGGHPQRLARQVIGELEAYPRGLYTGMVGWCDASGDGEWAVAIRCAQVRQNHIRLFAGAGVVGDSVAEKELAETEAKFNTMLHAIGVTSAGSREATDAN